MSKLDAVAMQSLLELMATLRDPIRGCPWDLQQTPQSIAPFTVEEAYEEVDAIESGIDSKQCEELGDLLLQVVFYAQMASETQRFDFNQVVDGIRAKLIRRHPHVFAPAANAAAQAHGSAQHSDRLVAAQHHWERIKSEEKKARGEAEDASVLAGVPKQLPALMRAQKLASRAAKIGFDWPNWHGARDKVAEELLELDQALDSSDVASIRHELGDLLQAVANLARQLELDAEQCLREANARFERRFAVVEQGVRGRSHVPLEEMEALWQQAKRGE